MKETMKPVPLIPLIIKETWSAIYKSNRSIKDRWGYWIYGIWAGRFHYYFTTYNPLIKSYIAMLEAMDKARDRPLAAGKLSLVPKSGLIYPDDTQIYMPHMKTSYIFHTHFWTTIPLVDRVIYHMWSQCWSKKLLENPQLRRAFLETAINWDAIQQSTKQDLYSTEKENNNPSMKKVKKSSAKLYLVKNQSNDE